MGSRPVHHELEAELAAWKGTEAAVLFTTGFAANLGVLGTFAGPDTLVCSDELNHASLIDGRRLAGAPLAVYRHCDAAHVDELLRACETPRAIVVTETVFSMDGDVAPVDKLAEVCAHHGALLVLDEAHAVLGPDPDDATLDGSTTCGSARCRRRSARSAASSPGRSRFTDLLVNRARSYIFTTASTPGRLRRRAGRVARRALPRGRASSATGCAPTSTACAPATRRRSSRSCAGAKRARSPPPTPSPRAGSSSPPSARRRCRRARRACGSRSRPTTRPTRSTRLPTALAELFPARDA